MIVYKVVRSSELQQHKHFFSAVMIDPRIAVEYKIGETTKPIIKSSYLMAFKTLTSAEVFVANNTNCESAPLHILRCQAKHCKHKHLRRHLSIADSYGIHLFWRNLHTWAITVPEGTVFCKEITPINIIVG